MAAPTTDTSTNDDYASLRLPSKLKERSKLQPAKTEKVIVNCHAIDMPKEVTVFNYEMKWFMSMDIEDPARRLKDLWVCGKNE